MSRSVAIVYGWAEGPWLSGQLRVSLKKSGFRIIAKVDDADVVFAHSMGCYMLPAHTKASKIILVGLPLFQGRSYLGSLLSKLLSEFRSHKDRGELIWWTKKLLFNTWYIFKYPSASWVVVTHRRQINIPNNASAAVVSNTDDSFSNKNEIKIIAKESGYRFIQLPGLHDDLWTNPKTYVDLIKKL